MASAKIKRIPIPLEVKSIEEKFMLCRHPDFASDIRVPLLDGVEVNDRIYVPRLLFANGVGPPAFGCDLVLRKYKEFNPRYKSKMDDAIPITLIVTEVSQRGYYISGHPEIDGNITVTQTERLLGVHRNSKLYGTSLILMRNIEQQQDLFRTEKAFHMPEECESFFAK